MPTRKNKVKSRRPHRVAFFSADSSTSCSSSSSFSSLFPGFSQSQCSLFGASSTPTFSTIPTFPSVNPSSTQTSRPFRSFSYPAPSTGSSVSLFSFSASGNPSSLSASSFVTSDSSSTPPLSSSRLFFSSATSGFSFQFPCSSSPSPLTISSSSSSTTPSVFKPTSSSSSLHAYSSSVSTTSLSLGSTMSFSSNNVFGASHYSPSSPSFFAAAATVASSAASSSGSLLFSHFSASAGSAFRLVGKVEEVTDGYDDEAEEVTDEENDGNMNPVGAFSLGKPLFPNFGDSTFSPNSLTIISHAAITTHCTPSLCSSKTSTSTLSFPAFGASLPGMESTPSNSSSGVAPKAGALTPSLPSFEAGYSVGASTPSIPSSGAASLVGAMTAAIPSFGAVSSAGALITSFLATGAPFSSGASTVSVPPFETSFGTASSMDFTLTPTATSFSISSTTTTIPATTTTLSSFKLTIEPLILSTSPQITSAPLFAEHNPLSLRNQETLRVLAIPEVPSHKLSMMAKEILNGRDANHADLNADKLMQESQTKYTAMLKDQAASIHPTEIFKERETNLPYANANKLLQESQTKSTFTWKDQSVSIHPSRQSSMVQNEILKEKDAKPIEASEEKLLQESQIESTAILKDQAVSIHSSKQEMPLQNFEVHHKPSLISRVLFDKVSDNQDADDQNFIPIFLNFLGFMSPNGREKFCDILREEITASFRALEMKDFIEKEKMFSTWLEFLQYSNVDVSCMQDKFDHLKKICWAHQDADREIVRRLERVTELEIFLTQEKDALATVEQIAANLDKRYVDARKI